MHIKLEHILLFAIAALMLYHFTKGCNCDGFSVGARTASDGLPPDGWVGCGCKNYTIDGKSCIVDDCGVEPRTTSANGCYGVSGYGADACHKAGIEASGCPISYCTNYTDEHPFDPKVYLPGKWVGKAPFCGAGGADCTALGKNWTEIGKAADSSGLITKYNSIVQERRIYATANGEDPNKGLLSPRFTSSFGSECGFGDKVYCELQSAK